MELKGRTGLHSKEISLQSVAVGQIFTLYGEGSPGTGVQPSSGLRDRAEAQVKTHLRDTQGLECQQKPPKTVSFPSSSAPYRCVHRAEQRHRSNTCWYRAAVLNIC